MLEDYLDERAENTQIVMFDRYFTLCFPGVCHIHLQLNLRGTVELTSLYEGWDHNAPPVICQPHLGTAQGPLAPASLGSNVWHLPGISGVREPKAMPPVPSFPSCTPGEAGTLCPYLSPDKTIILLVSFFPPLSLKVALSLPFSFLTVTFSCSTGKHFFIVWINFQTD